jgi:hypothetical protein
VTLKHAGEAGVGGAQEEDARTFEALSAPLYAQVERAITSRDAAAAAASK